MHGSLVEIGGNGLLIVGNSRSGKTALTISILDELDACLIADENTLLFYEMGIVGAYTPVTMGVRFHSVLESNLIGLLDNIADSEATQDIDLDTLEMIIQKKAYDADVTLRLSRKKFVNMLGTRSKPKYPINKIIFPGFIESNSIIRRDLSMNEIKSRLEASLLTERNIFLLEFPGSIKEEIPAEWLSDIKGEEILFRDITIIKNKSFLETLV